jgi:PAS domain S-box-containing protein
VIFAAPCCRRGTCAQDAIGRILARDNAGGEASVPAYSQFSADRLKDALQLVRAGLWERDLGTNKVRCTPIVEEMFGFSPGTAGDDAAHYLALLHPDDMEELNRCLQRAIARFEIDFRIIRSDGTLRWIAARA